MPGTETLIALAVAAMGGGQLWVYFASRGKQRVDLVELGQSIAAETIKGLREDRDALLSRISGLEDQIMALKEQIAELLAHAESMETALQKHGIDPPPRPRKRM